MGKGALYEMTTFERGDAVNAAASSSLRAAFRLSRLLIGERPADGLIGERPADGSEESGAHRHVLVQHGGDGRDGDLVCDNRPAVQTRGHRAAQHRCFDRWVCAFSTETLLPHHRAMTGEVTFGGETYHPFKADCNRSTETMHHPRG